MSRYARQELVIGADAQARLRSAHVLVVGAGGLGCPVLQYLVGAGIGEISLMDPDSVEESNLHRQPLYRMEDIGQPKCLSAARHLHQANPEVRLHPHLSKLTPSTAPRAVEQVDLVIDAADSFAVTYILSDTCRDQGKPLISASVLGQAGYVGAYCGGAPSLRAVFPDLPETAGSCAISGVLGPVVGMIGMMQAQMALALLTAHAPSPLGHVVTLDTEQWRFGTFAFETAAEPDLAWRFVDKSLLHPNDQLVELRPVEERPEPFAPSAQRLLPNHVTDAGLDPDRRVVLACQTGVRSWAAARRLSQSGFADIALLAEVAA